MDNQNKTQTTYKSSVLEALISGFIAGLLAIEFDSRTYFIVIFLLPVIIVLLFSRFIYGSKNYKQYLVVLGCHIAFFIASVLILTISGLHGLGMGM